MNHGKKVNINRVMDEALKMLKEHQLGFRRFPLDAAPDLVSDKGDYQLPIGLSGEVHAIRDR